MESGNVLKVKLYKKGNKGLGFLVKQRKEKPHVLIYDLVAGGMAQESGLVKIGDVVLSVNGKDISDASYESCLEILKSVPTDVPVELLLRVADGYNSHLETKFTEKGVPVTTRVSTPVVEDLSIVGRIRRKIGRSPSTKSPDRSKVSKNREANGVSKRSSKQSVEDDIFVDPLKSDLIEGNHVKSELLHANGTHVSKPEHKMERKINLNGKEVINIMGKGAQRSPEIVLTDTDDKGGDVHNSQEDKKRVPKSKSSIEILQDKEEITVIIKGDVKIQNDAGPSQKPSKMPETVSRLSLNPDDIGQEKKSSDSPKTRGSTPNTSPKRSPQKVASPGQKRYCKLKTLTDNTVMLDTLHSKSIERGAYENVACTANKCMGSVMGTFLGPVRPPSVPRSTDEMKVHAKDFFEQYYDSMKRLNSPAHNKRWTEVLTSIEQNGTYDLTYNELVFGAKTAWRNAPRCIGRIQWSKLQVFDARHIVTARGMFEAICTHIKYGTNKGNLRSAITIFPKRTDGKHDFKVWNIQVIRYAGYKLPDGTLIGDKSNVEFTELCMKLGWKGKYGKYDVLPLLLQANGEDPELFEIPEDLILEVKMKHPRFPWFEEMGIKWYVLPAVSYLSLDIGGIEFTGAPFNGWYMGTEIGARDLCDVNRYDISEEVGIKMGLDVKNMSSLWKDAVLVEVNIAVLYSFQQSGVTIADHHSASESFMKHLENEQRLRGGTPADWVWIVPPMSGSITTVFHQEMITYRLKPSLEYQEEAWKSHVWKKDRDRPKTTGGKQFKKISFRELARAVKFSAKLMGTALARRVKSTILYATETGKSERFARTLCEIFKHAFDAKVMCLDEYDVAQLEHEALLLIITSTFGSGDPPENGEVFAKSLYDMRHPPGYSETGIKPGSYIRMSTSSEGETSSGVDTLTEAAGKLSNVRFSVFGLGSKAYPNFCAFAHYIDNILNELGGDRIYKMNEGDELCGQEESFRSWASGVFKAACETFCVGEDVNMNEAAGALTGTEYAWAPNKFRLTPLEGEKEKPICESLSKLHGKSVRGCKLIEVTELQKHESDRQTILVKMDIDGNSDLVHAPGDHLALFAENSPEIVDAVLSRLQNSPPADQLMHVEMLQEKPGANVFGNGKNWGRFTKLPPCSLRTAFSRFLDITTPPSRALLKALSATATEDSERERLETLASNSEEYEDWRHENFPNLAEVLEEFPSVMVLPTLLISELPLLQQRYYSISSSASMFPGEVHLTVAIVKYCTKGGNGPVHEGVCSSWLHRLRPGQTIPCFLKSANAFHLPEDNTVPVIMVGPGTGIAPFRGFWQQRKIDRDMQPVPWSNERRGWGKMHLYFGCRNSKQDNIYCDELKESADEGVISVYTAFSREKDTPKIYVQDLLKKNGPDVFNALVKDQGHFYVCGDVTMAADVTTALEEIMQTVGGMSADMANNFIIKMTDANRFHKDIFGVLLRSSETFRESAKRAEKYSTTSSKSSNTKEYTSGVVKTVKRKKPPEPVINTDTPDPLKDDDLPLFLNRHIFHEWLDEFGRSEWYCGYVINILSGKDGDPDAEYEVMYDRHSDCFIVDHLLEDFVAGSLKFLDDIC